MSVSAQFLKEIKNWNPHLGMLLEQFVDQVNVSLNHLGMNTEGKSSPPPPIAGINVVAGSDHVHVTLSDNSQVKKNVQYMLEWSDNDPSFANPHVEHLGASRGKVLALAAKNGSGAQHQYYFRAYSQYLGSDPQKKIAYFGTKGAPTAVTLTGSSSINYLPSQGSGTARADGSQGGAGLGFVIERPPANAPKRPPPPKLL